MNSQRRNDRTPPVQAQHMLMNHTSTPRPSTILTLTSSPTIRAIEPLLLVLALCSQWVDEEATYMPGWTRL